MKKFSKKGVLLFAGAMAVCAFVMPSMASAASWGVVGSSHTLTSTNLGFVGDASNSRSMCAEASFAARVVSAATIEITAGSFTTCTLISGSFGATCVATPVGTFPWTATAVTTSNIQIHGVDIDIPLENHSGSVACGPLNNQSLRITGTLSGARWHGNTAGRTIELLGSTGLSSHSPLPSTEPITPTGTITDTQETLTIT